MRTARHILFFLGLTAVALPAGAQGRRDRDREVRLDTTFAFAARGSADLNLGDGDVIISSWDRNQVRVQVTGRDRGYELRTSDGRFSLDPESVGRTDARVEITVPAGTRLSLETRNGDIRISRINADVSIRGQSGDVTASDITGRFEASLMNGDVTASTVTGDVQVNSISGDVTLERITGQVEVETVSGDISLRDATSKSVRLHTTSGDVEYAGTVALGGRYELAAHSGDVNMTMPADPSARITVSTFNGEIQSDFPITLAPGDHDIGVGRSKRFTFDVGRGGDARVSLESFSGDITLRGRGVPRSNR